VKRSEHTDTDTDTDTDPDPEPGPCVVASKISPPAAAPSPPGVRGPRAARAYPEGVADRSASALGDFIRRQRELTQVSMRQFADLVGISNPYLSQIERGLRAPSDQVVQAIADALKISADSLYEQAGVRAEADVEPDVVQAIREDPKLSARQRQALIEIYESFAGTTPRRRRRGTHDGSGTDDSRITGA
jgi:transcriptional regulator with XRE-family HTH domain